MNWIVALYLLVAAINAGSAITFESGSSIKDFTLGRDSSSDSSTVDRIFQIPITVLQGTASAAQTWNPDNAERISKLFDIPVKTLEAVGNLVNDRVPENVLDKTGDRTVRRHFHAGKFGWLSELLGNQWYQGGGHQLHGHKKKKKKKPIYHQHYHQHYVSQQPPAHYHRPTAASIFGTGGHTYQVTEQVDDIPAPSFYPWRPNQQDDRIQNKIAPKFPN